MERTLREIADFLGGELAGDGTVRIHGLAGVLEAEQGELTFIRGGTYRRHLASTRASAALVGTDFGDAPLPVVRVAKPDRAFELLLDWFRPAPIAPSGNVDALARVAADARLGERVTVMANAFIGPGARVGDGTCIHAGAYVGPGVSIGRDCIVHPNVTVQARARVGDRVILHAGCVIGADGFGYRPGPAGLEKLEHIGTVSIGDDVEIGACTTIDRARFGRTVIGKGTKIDNLVQIAHNVRIGAHCVIAAQTGISGSSIVGDGCVVGGQVGIVPHVIVGERCQVAARSGVSKDVAPDSTIYGYVARNHLEKKREDAALRKLPELIQRVRALEAGGREGTRADARPDDER